MQRLIMLYLMYELTLRMRRLHTLNTDARVIGDVLNKGIEIGICDEGTPGHNERLDAGSIHE